MDLDSADKNKFRKFFEHLFEHLGEQFIEILKTDNYKKALDTVSDLEEMSDDDFFDLINKRTSVLDERSLAEVKTLVDKYKLGQIEDDTFSPREIVLLTIQGMIRSQEFSDIHNQKQNELSIAELDKLPQEDDIVLSPAEILLLRYIDGRSSVLDLPGYFTHQYHIDYKQTVERFFHGRYLEFAPAEYALEKAAVKELKEILKSNSLSVTGKKADLISRIISDVQPEYLSNYEKMYYKATSAGKQLISDNEHIYFFHSVYNRVSISIDEADNYKKHHPIVSIVEIGNDILDTRIDLQLAERNYNFVRNSYLSKAIVNQNCSLPYKALENYCIVCCMDNTLCERFTLRDPGFSIFADGVISAMKMIIDGEKTTKAEFKQCFDNAMDIFFSNSKYDLTSFSKSGVLEKLYESLYT